MDCYDPEAVIVDAVLWSYDPSLKGIWVGTLKDGIHSPHGIGYFWEAGRPSNCQPKHAVKLTPRNKLSEAAKWFLEILGPLDIQGWCNLMRYPMQGWPAGEILCAMADTKNLEAVVPIDLLGMLTDRNPSGLYL